MKKFFPHFASGDYVLDNAFRIAVGNITTNIIPFKDGLLEKPSPAVMAGLSYNTPWTRDAAINTWNGTGLLFPEVTRNTLLSVLKNENGRVLIDGQYWDAIIWTTGAWWQYLYTGDMEFLSTAYEATCNSLEYFEAAEFDRSLNLFRGPAVYGDGIAAYPDIYANTKGGSSCILDWPEANPRLVSKPGYGIPMCALSTNCLYYNAYILAEKMANELGLKQKPEWSLKANNLKKAIDDRFWMAEKGYYRYLVDRLGNCDRQEGLGHCFVLLFGIADRDKRESVFRNLHITPAGIPCVWPSFERYSDPQGYSVGRHSGTVWPHIQGFWATTAAGAGETDIFEYELRKLAGHACRDNHFAEIYHPFTGEIYGGMQEMGVNDMRLWGSCPIQTWSATAYIRMILMGIAGMDFETGGIRFSPNIPSGLDEIHLDFLPYRDMLLFITIKGHGKEVFEFSVDNRSVEYPFISLEGSGEKHIVIKMGE